MRKTDRRDEMEELNEDATDGQMADYIASECSGERGAWNIGITEYSCNKCGLLTQVVSDVLPSYSPLISAWHDKSAEGDTFSRFVFLYLAFIAHIRNNLFYDVTSDRRAIQRLKQADNIRKDYLELISNNETLAKNWSEVIGELGNKPLHNSSRDPGYPEIGRWWNVDQDQIEGDGDMPKGRVLSLDDWGNMIEFWYGVRNNLFHGGKNPNTGRDAFLVEHAFQTLRPLMDIEIRKL